MTTGRYAVEVYVCINDRLGVKKSCADGHAEEMLQMLKEGVQKKKLDESVKVESTGCLGLCEDGPNVMLFPQAKMFCDYTLDDVDNIISEISQIVEHNQ